ncbi:hypothetical protein KW429_11415 [Vibrio fluvialis]|nr:hypothetical protein [Vibrio fluvialis]
MKSSMILLATTALLVGCASEQPVALQDNIEFETSYAKQSVISRAEQSEHLTLRKFQIAKNKAINLISFYTPNNEYCTQYVSGISLTTYDQGLRQIATAIINDYCEPFDKQPTLDTLSNYVLKPHFTRLKGMESVAFNSGLSYEVLVF